MRSSSSSSVPSWFTVAKIGSVSSSSIATILPGPTILLVVPFHNTGCFHCALTTPFASYECTVLHLSAHEHSHWRTRPLAVVRCLGYANIANVPNFRLSLVSCLKTLAYISKESKSKEVLFMTSSTKRQWIKMQCKNRTITAAGGY